MKKALFLLVSVLFIQSAFSQDILDQFPKPATSVVDFENLFTDQEEIMLNNLIKIYYKQTDVQIVIVTIDKKSITAEQFDSLTLEIANKWGINGIIIGVSKGLRKIRIQNSVGPETKITDDETKQIIDTVFIPKFKEGLYYKGTREGIQAIVNHLKNN
ncbi:TPM domain-containing protein [Flavobacterium sp. AG291]|uniref:TPM domain-containing protein n=1 Tax=Flavobacterium sp. AG291 TaxID=2184000 RepID=UPI000E0B132F|nr:TPM domain-containing protein [Flavobacterium sp. AG291]RDI13147.1 TLP18.3/Psb32/MOLO-1 phosphatase superfamily protein [Flavobacterium sp. AG291]